MPTARKANPRSPRAKPRLAQSRRVSHSSPGLSPDSPFDARLNRVTKQTWALALILAVTTFAGYSPILSHPFVNYDDPDYVTQNPQVQRGLTFETLAWALASTEHSNWHPVTWLSHALDCDLFGLNPAGHHFTSLLLHAVNAALLFLFLTWVTGKAGSSLFVAALFAFHPLNVESVAWIAERKTLLSMFFLLLTLFAYIWYARRPRMGPYVCMLTLFALGLAAKPMIVTLPFAMLVLDYWPLQRIQEWTVAAEILPMPQWPWRWLLIEKIPLLLISAGSSVITVIAQRGSILPSEFLPLGARLSNAVRSYGLYLAKTFWPNPLAVYYTRAGSASWEAAVSLAILAGLSAIVWRFRSRGYLPTGWLWFLGTMVPMIGLVQVGNQAMADRYAYLPLIGIFIAITWGIGEFASRRDMSPKICVLAGVIVVVALSCVSFRQVRVWRSSLELWTRALEVTQDNYVANDNLAYELLSEGRPQEALPYFQTAASLAPADPLSHWALAASLQDRGRLQEAAQNYEVVIRNPENQRQLASACLSAAVISSELGDYQSASEYSREALQADRQTVTAFVLDAQHSVAQVPSASMYLRLGLLLEQVQQIQGARQAYEQVVKLDPNSALARRLLDHLRAAP
jgi:protein O-mannosyl-transferase